MLRIKKNSEPKKNFRIVLQAWSIIVFIGINNASSGNQPLAVVRPLIIPIVPPNHYMDQQSTLLSQPGFFQLFL